MEEAETMALWTAKLELTYRCDLHEPVGDDLIENDILDTFVPHEDPGVSQHRDCMTRSEAKNLMENNIKTTFEVAMKCITTGIVGKTIEVGLTAGYDV